MKFFKLLTLFFGCLIVAACAPEPEEVSVPTEVTGQSSPIAVITQPLPSLTPTPDTSPTLLPPTLTPEISPSATIGPMPPTFTPNISLTPISTPNPPATPSLPPSPPLPEEAIFIQAPGIGARIASPLVVRGVSNPAPEQTVVVRVVSIDGTELALEPTTIQADLGQRGPFELSIPLTITEEQPAFVQVFVTSARDGGITHLSSVGITLVPDESVAAGTPQDDSEDIVIMEPAFGAMISGGTIRVSGQGRASFENTLVVDLLDHAGNTLAREAVIVHGPLGEIGFFNVDLPYSVSESGRGRVVVRDMSPAFGGTVHLSSVEILLEGGQK